MSIQALNSSRAVRFNAPQTTAKTMTVDELLALIQSGQNSKQAAEPQIVVVTVPQATANNSSPTNTSTTNQSSSPNLLMRAIDLSALLFLAALVGTFGMNLLNKWGLTDSEGKFKAIPETLFTLKIDDKLPDKLFKSLTEAWTGIEEKYKTGFNAKKDELTVGHYLEALSEMFKAEPDKVIEISGKTHRLLKDYFEQQFPGFTKWFGNFFKPFMPEEETKVPSTIIILDEQEALKLKTYGESLNTLLFNVSKVDSKKGIVLSGAERSFKEELSVTEKAEFILGLRKELLQITGESNKPKGLSELMIFINDESLNKLQKKEDLESFFQNNTEGTAERLWGRIVLNASNLAENLQNATVVAT